MPRSQPDSESPGGPGPSLTVEPARLLPEPWPQVRVRVGQVVEEQRQGGDQQREAPGVQLVDTEAAQLLAPLQRRRPEVSAKTGNETQISNGHREGG